MKKSNRMKSLVLIVSVVGVLGLTIPEYTGCDDLYPDEFLDLGMLCQYPIPPVLTPHLKTYASNPPPVKMSGPQKPKLLSTVLRC